MCQTNRFECVCVCVCVCVSVAKRKKYRVPSQTAKGVSIRNSTTDVCPGVSEFLGEQQMIMTDVDSLKHQQLLWFAQSYANFVLKCVGAQKGISWVNPTRIDALHDTKSLFSFGCASRNRSFFFWHDGRAPAYTYIRSQHNAHQGKKLSCEMIYNHGSIRSWTLVQCVQSKYDWRKENYKDHDHLGSEIFHSHCGILILHLHEEWQQQLYSKKKEKYDTLRYEQKMNIWDRAGLVFILYDV